MSAAQLFMFCLYSFGLLACGAAMNNPEDSLIKELTSGLTMALLIILSFTTLISLTEMISRNW